MKNLFLFGLLFLGSTILTGCNDIKDGPGMEREIKYPIAEQVCIDNGGEITEDDKGTPICLLGGRGINLEDMEEYPENDSMAVYCEVRGGKYKVWHKGGEQHEFCFFDDESFCYVDDLANNKCKKGDIKYYDNEQNFFEGGGEWITIVTDMCEEQGGVVEQWLEGGDKQDVCYFDDKTFCYLEDFAAGNCKKGDMSYINDGVVYEYPPKDQLNGKPMEEAFCDYNAGVITENEYGDRFCTFSDGGYYELKAFKELGEMPSLRGPDEPYCSDFEDIVCGTDGNGYVNECWMKSAGVEEETELAEVVDGKCIYG